MTLLAFPARPRRTPPTAPPPPAAHNLGLLLVLSASALVARQEPREFADQLVRGGQLELRFAGRVLATLELLADNAGAHLEDCDE